MAESKFFCRALVAQQFAEFLHLASTAPEEEYSTVVGDGISVLIAKAGSRDPDDQGPDYVLTVKDKNDVEMPRSASSRATPPASPF